MRKRIILNKITALRKGRFMKKFVSVLMIFLFTLTLDISGCLNSFAFELTIKRDPFMDLIKLKELKEKEKVVFNNYKISEDRKIEERINSVVHSISIKMVVVSKNNPKMDAALIVGPSGEPVVVYKDYRLAKDVYVSKIINNGIVLSFETKKGIKNATVKMKTNKK